MAWATPATWSDADSAAAVLARMNTAIRDVLTPPLLIDVDVFAEPKSQTNWNTLNVDINDARIHQCARESTGAQNAEIAWDVFIPPGTWEIDLVYHKNTDIGIYHVYFGGVQQTTIDGYASPGANNQIGSATGIVIGAPATLELKLKMESKNASSSAYYGSISALRLRRTDTPPTPQTWVAGVLERSELNTYLRDVACAPALFDIDVFLPATANTNWSTLTVDSGDLLVHAGTRNSSGAQNAEVSWDLIVPAGTWRVDVMHRKGSDRGIYSVQLDGVEKGTIDGYAAATAYNQTGSVTGIAIATTDKHTLKLRMATKHASSASYVGSIQHVRLRRTDTPAAVKTWALNDEPTAAMFNANVRDVTAPRVLIDIDVFNLPKAQTNFGTVAIDGSNVQIYQAQRNSTGAQNAEITWDVELCAGTWRVDLMYTTNTGEGIYSVQLDGVEKGTIDGYNAAFTFNNLASVTGIVVATTKHYELKLKMASKNASSSNYGGTIQGLRLRRTDI